MNSIKLAEENVKASLLKKVLKVPVLNCRTDGQESLKSYFNHCLTGWNCFQRLHINAQAEESEFQKSEPWANLIKMKTHFQFVSMNWNIPSSKMVKNSILQG